MANTRYTYIDLLNIIACMGVVFLHSTNMYIFDYSGDINLPCIFSLFIFSVLLWPVDVFFMISGSTLIKESSTFSSGSMVQFYKNRVKRILIPLLVWNLLYGIKFWIWKDNMSQFNICEALKRFIELGYNPHFWFFIPLIVIYISMPFIASFAINASKKELQFFLILGFVLIAIIEPILEYLHIETFGDLFPFGCQYIIFAIAGYYISNYNIGIKGRRVLYCLAVASALILFFAGIYVAEHRQSTYILHSYTFAPCVLTALGMFTFVRNLNFGRINTDFIRKWSSLSFGIYLCQAMFFTMTNKVPFPIGNHPAILFPTVYLLCLISVSIIKKIPILNKIV